MMSIANRLAMAVIAAGCLVTSTYAGGADGRVSEDEESTIRPIDVKTVTGAQREAMVDYLREKGRAPGKYILSKFTDHDLVIIGETHRMHENCRCISEVIAPLHRAGVHLLLSEFVRNRNTERLNRLLTAKTWDADAIHEIMRDWAWPIWGFEEYRAIFHEAWKVNRDRPEGGPPFRIVGLDDEWDQWEYGWSDLSRKEKFEGRLKREEHLVAVAEKEVFEAKKKALVHIGYSHSLTGHGIRFGTVLTRNHGNRVFQVVLHSELPSRRGRTPLVAFLESLWKDAGAKPVGFDVMDSPLGGLRDKECVLWNYLKEGTFQEFALGYVFIAPLDDLNKATWIEGFIDEADFERARKVAIAAGMAKEDECETPQTLDACMQRLYPGPKKRP